MSRYPSAEQRLWARVEILQEDDCWVWTGSCTRGYGNIFYDGKPGKTHRLSLEIKIGRKLEDGEQSLHTCDNPPCVNPKHLFVGTQHENITDCVDKGRWANGNVDKTQCKRGHEFTEQNTRVNPRGQRVCKACDRLLQQERYRNGKH